MTRLVIGSTAIARFIPGFRQPKDYDLFTDEDCPARPPFEPFWHPLLADVFPDRYGFATLDELYTIKLSHSAWDLHGTWEKHMRDVVDLRVHGAELDQALYDVLYRVWEDVHGRKRVDLDKDKAEFFDDAVRRQWDHDSIHVSVAYGDRPIYEQFLANGASVKMDMEKVWAAAKDVQIKLFREEIYATALERWVIPSDYTFSPGKAYAWALRKTVTSLTKGKSSLFIAQNYDVFRNPDVDYVSRHRSRAHLLVPA